MPIWYKLFQPAFGGLQLPDRSGAAPHCEPRGDLPSPARCVIALARREAGNDGRTANIHITPRTYLADPAGITKFRCRRERNTNQDDIPRPSPNRARRADYGPRCRRPKRVGSLSDLCQRKTAAGRLARLRSNRSMPGDGIAQPFHILRAGPRRRRARGTRRKYESIRACVEKRRRTCQKRRSPARNEDGEQHRLAPAAPRMRIPPMRRRLTTKCLPLNEEKRNCPSWR